MKKIKIKKLTKNAFFKYGRIIDGTFIKDNGTGDKYAVLLKERSKGWRIGYLILRKKALIRLESHPDSLETFEPVRGRAVIAVSAKERPDAVEIFDLDGPVVINKGIWHDVMSASKQSELKIFENMDVIVKYRHLKSMIML